MQPCSCYPLQITCMNCRYCFSAKIDTTVIFFQSIAPPTKRSLASHFTFKNGNTAVTGRPSSAAIIRAGQKITKQINTNTFHKIYEYFKRYTNI